MALPTIIYAIEVEQDDLPVRGNAMASGDAAEDKAVEDEILARLDAGDVWAWASVKVTATCEGFTGVNYLGACSYKDEAEFRADPYFEDMCKEALYDLRGTIQRAVDRGEAARVLLKRIAP